MPLTDFHPSLALTITAPVYHLLRCGACSSDLNDFSAALTSQTLPVDISDERVFVLSHFAINALGSLWAKTAITP
jgi:hypothetical protein